MKHWKIALPSLALAAVSGTFAYATFQETPAFNTELRQETVLGRDTLWISSEMYNLPAYLFQVGTSYVRSDLLLTSDVDVSGMFASAETSFERAEKAVEFLMQSLNKNPANAHVWTMLAWAEGLRGEYEAAYTALAHSWQLAPHSRQLAESRMDLAILLFEQDEDLGIGLAPGDEDIAYIKKDLAVLQMHDKINYLLYAEQVPHLLD